MEDMKAKEDAVHSFMEDFSAVFQKHVDSIMKNDAYASICCSIIGTISLHLSKEGFIEILTAAMQARSEVVGELMKDFKSDGTLN